MSRYLSSAFVLLPSDVFPLPVEGVSQPPRFFLLKVLRNVEFTDIVKVIICTTDQAGKGVLMAADTSGIGAIRHAAVVVRDLDLAEERYTNERVREGLR